MDARPLRFVATPSKGEVGALLLRPVDAAALLVLAHGAGAGMEHEFMAGLARALAERRIATLRYRFPYAESGSRRPDPPAVLEATARAAAAAGAAAAPDLPVFAGGKSMGGRMTSRAASAGAGLAAHGIVCFGFPLHAAGGPPGVERAAHLAAVPQPILFLQGTRDALASPDLVQSLVARLGARATLHLVEGADHSFHVPKRSGRSDAQVLDELLDAFAAWSGSLA